MSSHYLVPVLIVSNLSTSFPILNLQTWDSLSLVGMGDSIPTTKFHKTNTTIRALYVAIENANDQSNMNFKGLFYSPSNS